MAYVADKKLPENRVPYAAYTFSLAYNIMIKWDVKRKQASPS